MGRWCSGSGPGKGEGWAEPGRERLGRAIMQSPTLLASRSWKGEATGWHSLAPPYHTATFPGTSHRTLEVFCSPHLPRGWLPPSDWPSGARGGPGEGGGGVLCGPLAIMGVQTLVQEVGSCHLPHGAFAEAAGPGGTEREERGKKVSERRICCSWQAVWKTPRLQPIPSLPCCLHLSTLPPACRMLSGATLLLLGEELLSLSMLEKLTCCHSTQPQLASERD